MITTSTGAKKLESSDNWREIFPNPGTSAAGAHNASVDAQDRIQAEVAPIINGKRCSLGAASGDYVLLRNSTIAGKTDGAYQAAKAIPANTDLDSTYLGSPITGGMVNELNSNLTNKLNPSMTTVYGEDNRGAIMYGGVWQIGLLCTVCVIFVANVDSGASPGVLYGMPGAKYDSALSAIDITDGISSAIRNSVPCGVSTNGRCFMKEIVNGHIYAISGTYVTA